MYKSLAHAELSPPLTRHASGSPTRRGGTSEGQGRLQCPSDALLEGSDGEGLHHRLGRLGLHNDDLAEYLPLARFRRRLQPRLDHADTRDDHLPRLLHLLARDGRHAVEHLRALGLLQLRRRSYRLAEGTLREGLGPGLHRLHGLHRLRSHLNRESREDRGKAAWAP